VKQQPDFISIKSCMSYRSDIMHATMS